MPKYLHSDICEVVNWRLRLQAVVKRLIALKDRTTVHPLYAWGRMTITIKDDETGVTVEIWKPKRHDIIAIFTHIHLHADELFADYPDYVFAWQTLTDDNRLTCTDLCSAGQSYHVVQGELNNEWGVHKRRLCPALHTREYLRFLSLAPSPFTMHPNVEGKASHAVAQAPLLLPAPAGKVQYSHDMKIYHPTQSIRISPEDGHSSNKYSTNNSSSCLPEMRVHLHHMESVQAIFRMADLSLGYPDACFAHHHLPFSGKYIDPQWSEQHTFPCVVSQSEHDPAHVSRYNTSLSSAAQHVPLQVGSSTWRPW